MNEPAFTGRPVEPQHSFAMTAQQTALFLVCLKSRKRVNHRVRHRKWHRRTSARTGLTSGTRVMTSAGWSGDSLPAALIELTLWVKEGSSRGRWGGPRFRRETREQTLQAPKEPKPAARRRSWTACGRLPCRGLDTSDGAAMPLHERQP